MSSEGGKDEEPQGGGNDTVAKTAGFLVLSGIAMSILKALNPFNPNNSNTTCHEPIDINTTTCNNPTTTPLVQEFTFQHAHQEPIIKSQKGSSGRVIEIVRGDTLWGLARKYGVTIDAIKEANGIEGDTIYAGKKLVIP